MTVNKIAIISALMVPLALGIVGCTGCEDCNGSKITYRFINKSSYNVDLAFVNQFGDSIEPTGKIAKSDSVEFTGMEGKFLTPYQFHAYPSAKGEILFGSSPERCLVFNGPITDSTADIRSPKAYDGQGGPFFYTINDSLFQKAGVCNP